MSDPGDPKGGIVTFPAVRDSDPSPSDFGVVSRIITSTAAPLVTEEKPAQFAIRTSVFPDAGPSPGPKVLLEALDLRRGAILVNNSPTATLYIALETAGVPLTVSPSFFTFALPPMGSFIMPFPPFEGRIDGYWDPVAVTDNVQITDLV
jgi:hypothetical protein